jgi:hypothetical protein
MKKIILSLTLVVISLMTVPSAVFGTLMIDPVIDPGAPVPAAVDPNAHINLFAGGTTSQTSLTVAAGATFSLDTYIQFTGFTTTGLSYWVEAASALAPHLTLTTESYFQNWNGNQTGTNTAFNFNTNGTDSGFLREQRDLGSTSGFNSGVANDPRTAGTYQVSTLNFSLDPSTPAGTYLIQLTTLSPVVSEINDNQATPQDHAVALASFTLTVVPEPATLSLLGLGGLGSLGMTVLRARRRKA